MWRTIYHQRHAGRIVVWRGLAALAAGLLAGALLAPAARASLGACLSDPVVILSGGVTIDLYTIIHAHASDVQQVNYTLHAPVGMRLLRIIPTRGVIGPKEKVQFAADDMAQTYDTVTEVDTVTRGIAVHTRTTVLALGHLPVTGSAAGQDHQNLPVHLVL